MYILFEMSSVDGGASIWNFDCLFRIEDYEAYSLPAVSSSFSDL